MKHNRAYSTHRTLLASLLPFLFFSALPACAQYKTNEDVSRRASAELLQHKFAVAHSKTDLRAAAILKRQALLVEKAKFFPPTLTVEEYEIALAISDDPAIHRNLGRILIKSGRVFQGAAELKAGGVDPYFEMYPELHKGDFQGPYNGNFQRPADEFSHIAEKCHQQVVLGRHKT